MGNTKSFLTLYTPYLRFEVDGKVIEISPGDIVSLTVMNQYDTASYSMIRLRLYADISMLRALMEKPDKIKLKGRFDGSIYRQESDQSPIPVKPVKSIELSHDVYIEYKNTPTSEMDNYENGLPRTTDNDLNVNKKVAIEVYCYEKELIHRMNSRAPSVFKSVTMHTLIEALFYRAKIWDVINEDNYTFSFPENGTRYDQVLIPNLTVLEALSFLDKVYGLYSNGGCFFGDITGLYLIDLTVDSKKHTFQPIYVKSYESTDDTSGMMEIVNDSFVSYKMQTAFSGVSILSESDIEKTLQPHTIISENVDTLDIRESQLGFLGDIGETSKRSQLAIYNDRRFSAMSDNLRVHDRNLGIESEIWSDYIDPKIVLNKYPSKFTASARVARIYERMTRVDVSGFGWDIRRITPSTRYNLVFESPIRGLHMNRSYRASYVCHTIEPTSQNLFAATTTMSLCSNQKKYKEGA